RDVAIDGDLKTSWHWHAVRDGAQVWAPGLQVSAEKVRIGNPEWAKKRAFAQLEGIELDLRLLPLLGHAVVIPRVRLVKPSLDFERRKDDSNTWTFASSGQSGAWNAEVGEIEFDAGDIAIADAQRDLDVHVEIEPLDVPIPFGQRVEGDDPTTRRGVIQRVGKTAARRLHEAAESRARKRTVENSPPPYRFGWTAKGTMRGAKIDGNGRFGGVLALSDSNRPFPVRADIEVGNTEIALTGTITDPTSPDAIDMRLWISGSNLADLYPIAGLSLPQTPSYASVGRLSGHFHPHSTSLKYEDFTARVGGSDLAGTLTYKSGDPRATLTGEVDSTLLQVEDLGTLVGVNGADGNKAGDTSRPRSGRVLPSSPFDVQRWNAMDADVHFTGKQVVRVIELPIHDVDTQIVMKDGKLMLDPLRFGMAGGTVKASLHIDANTKPVEGTVALDAQRLLLRKLFAHTDGLSTSEGEVSATTRLAGSGNSIASILGTSNGSLKILMTDGQVSEELMEKAGLNVGNLVLTKLTGDRRIAIDCAVADFTAKDGSMTSDVFVFDTENARIDIDGHIRLSDESVDLTAHPQTKGIRLLSLRSPLHIEGSFRHVEVSVDKKQLLLRGGAAIGLGLVAPPAALLALTALGGDTPKSCAGLIEQVKQSGGKTPDSKKAAPSPIDRSTNAKRKPSRD
ncbi:MAG: AsmA family protein, partial [Dokdonella sp.]|uniref:AsmA family protein n=1 Tax=Dokdonella sp. TaxID=2291710 RepID=UPI003265876C